MSHIRQKLPKAPLVGIGFSLGSNVLVKFACEEVWHIREGGGGGGNCGDGGGEGGGEEGLRKEEVERE